jgi:hypothetical protein
MFSCEPNQSLFKRLALQFLYVSQLLPFDLVDVLLDSLANALPD